MIWGRARGWPRTRSKRRRHVWIILLAIALVVTWQRTSSGQELTKVRLVHVAYAPNQAVAWVARDAGYFAKQGLDVEIVRIGGSSTVVQTMVAGETHLAHVGASAVIEASLAGADLAIVAGTIKVPLFRLMGDPALKSPSDLKGKKAGITRFGASSDFLLRWALVNKLGLTPDRDVPILQLGGMPELLAAAKAGAIDAAVLSTPEDFRAEQMGWKALADFSTMGIDYMTGTLAATRKYIQTQDDVLRRFMKAFVQGIHRMKTDKEFTFRSLEKFMRTTDRELLEVMYAREVLRGMEKVPLPSLPGLQTVLHELAPTRPAVKGKHPQDFVDERFVRELQTSGYIDALYK